MGMGGNEYTKVISAHP